MTVEPYKSTFFIIPSRILELPDITLAYIRFYETIFQFWNHGKPCYLTNGMIKERTGIKSDSTIQSAFEYFESHNEMLREVHTVQNGTRRYIVQPPTHIEIDVYEENEARGGVSVEREGGSRCSERGGLGRARLNKNNSNTKNNNKNICASDDALAGFEDFKKIYPVRKNWYKAKEIWSKKKCYKLKDKIIDHVKNSIQRDIDWKKGIIPHPTTYLNRQRWDDEIKTQEAQGFKSFQKPNELHSTVPEYIPDNTPFNREAGIKAMESIRKTLGIKSDAKTRLNRPALSLGEIYGGTK